jgi:hypothetical protein
VLGSSGCRAGIRVLRGVGPLLVGRRRYPGRAGPDKEARRRSRGKLSAREEEGEGPTGGVRLREWLRKERNDWGKKGMTEKGKELLRKERNDWERKGITEKGKEWLRKERNYWERKGMTEKGKELLRKERNDWESKGITEKGKEWLRKERNYWERKGMTEKGKELLREERNDWERKGITEKGKEWLRKERNYWERKGMTDLLSCFFPFLYQPNSILFEFNSNLNSTPMHSTKLNLCTSMNAQTCWT